MNQLEKFRNILMAAIGLVSLAHWAAKLIGPLLIFLFSLLAMTLAVDYMYRRMGRW